MLTSESKSGRYAALVRGWLSRESSGGGFIPEIDGLRFIAISGTIPAGKSGTPGYRSEQELRSMSYKEVCKLYNIPE